MTESITEFLARGGKIKRVPTGDNSGLSNSDWEKASPDRKISGVCGDCATCGRCTFMEVK